MNRRSRVVTVRFDETEFTELRKLPGESDAARIRALLHSTAINQNLTAEIASAASKAVTITVATDGDRTRKLVLTLAEQINQLLGVKNNENPVR